MSNNTARPQVSSWWSTGNGGYMRYYGRINATVRKVRPGCYEATAGTPEQGTVHTLLSGTAAGAKRDMNQWLANSGSSWA